MHRKLWTLLFFAHKVKHINRINSHFYSKSKKNQLRLTNIIDYENVVFLRITVMDVNDSNIIFLVVLIIFVRLF